MIRIIINRLYIGYAFIIFTVLFLIFFWVLLIPICFPKTFKLTGIINRLWARILFFFTRIPYELEYRFKLDSSKQYIFCPNHFSYLDIPAMGLNHHNTIFVGKSAMEKIPLFGFMYRKLHITVDRSKLKSRYSTLLRSMQAIDDGKSLVIFPEGGMITQTPPHMVKLKDGAFRIATQKQIAIVPVTIPYNWIILPDQPDLFIHWGKMKIIFHEPQHPNGNTPEEMEELKQRVLNVIDTERKTIFNTKS